MKSIVIDANVFAAYALEHLGGAPTGDRTASPITLFDLLGTRAVAFIDDGGQIEQEWRTLANYATEWFNEWLADSLADGRIYEIPPSTDPQLVRRYKALGFPNTTDIWYIKTAHGLCHICKRSRPFLIAEDIDFYDPKLKKAPNKVQIFRRGTGTVCDRLEKDGIDLRCIDNATKEILGC
ncbi:MAG: hypothetical protein ACK4NM_05285 [Hydrogenophaga sp.]